MELFSKSLDDRVQDFEDVGWDRARWYGGIVRVFGGEVVLSAVALWGWVLDCVG